MQNLDEKPVVFELKASCWLKRWLFGIHGLALINCLAVDVGLSASVGLLLMIAGSFIYQFYVYTCRQGVFRFAEHSGWAYSSDGRTYQPVVLNQSVMIAPFVLIVSIQMRGRNTQWVIASDAMKQEAFRQLIALLKSRNRI